MNKKEIIVIFILLAVLLMALSFVFVGDFEAKSQIIAGVPVQNNLRVNAPKINANTFIAPKIIKAVYLTGWSAGTPRKVDYVINLAKTTEINAVVIDIKDFSGYVDYNTSLPQVNNYNAKQIKISDIDSLVNEFHDNGIYTIARITVFQDPILAKARPDLAIHKISALKTELKTASSDLSISSLWVDHKGLSWLDPAAKEVWAYNLAIAKDTLSHGFDEVNFDYIRYLSDGNLADMYFPVSGTNDEPGHETIKKFFRYLSFELSGAKISVDIFGLSTVSANDLGIGQIIEDAFPYFDYIDPMVYPSHYASGFMGYANPAAHPYEIINYSLQSALVRLQAFRENEKTASGDGSARNAVLRPWLQDFNLGATYNSSMVKAEINAVYDSLGTEDFNGFMLWNPSNIYTAGALQKE